MFDIGRAGNQVDQKGKIGNAAYLLESAVAFELIGKRDEINVLTLVIKFQDRSEYLPVSLLIEPRFVQDLDGRADGFFIDQQRTQNGFLSVDVLRGGPLFLGDP